VLEIASLVFGIPTLVFGIASLVWADPTLVCVDASLVWADATLVCVDASLVLADATLVLTSLVEATWVTPGLVAMAFLVAIRLLISDFFSIDIAFSSVRVFYSRLT
jgi:hypothetical protein